MGAPHDLPAAVAPAARRVFVTGGTGYLGRPTIARLVAAGHQVRALARPASVDRLPEGAEAVLGDALETASYRDRVAPCDTFLHLVGVAHPSPAKAAAFLTVDLASTEAAVEAAQTSGVVHFVYLSVAKPAPVMKDYVAARARGEELIFSAGFSAVTILRPWYVLGPGHRWPCVLAPFYALARLLPATREGALRLGLVTREQMVAALLAAATRPLSELHVVEVPAIRHAATAATAAA